MPSASTTYRLAAHVRACAAGRHIIFLDLKRDRYFGVGEDDAHTLRARVSGIPALTETADQRPAARDPTDLFEHMLKEGLLAPGSAAASQFINTSGLVRPEKSIIDGYETVPVRVRALDVMRFASAAIRTFASVRWRSFERNVLTGRKAMSGPVPERLLVDSRTRIGVFDRIRPFLFSDHDECLLHSMMVKRFLTQYRIFPHLVIGVATEPFRAHCWLQLGDTVLNDDVDNVREYVPIFSI